MSETPFGTFDETADATSADITNGLGEPIRTDSIIDTMLNLDEFLSGDVRRAEKTARFCTRPDLEARMDDLHAELDSLTDSQGRPLPVIDQTVGDGGRSAHAVALDLQEATREYAAAMVSIRMRALDEDDWTALLARHKKALDEGLPYPPVFYEDLIARTAVKPPFTEEQVKAFRAKVGHAVFGQVAAVAWEVNTASGVSIPKSSLSSAVLRQQTQG